MKPKIINLNPIEDRRGNLVFIESFKYVPFAIERVYYLYNIPDGETRGAHGHIKLQQLIIALNGSFDLTLDDGSSKTTFTLNNPSKGIYIPPLHWRDLSNFSNDAVCLVLASLPYSEDDYIRDYESFISFVGIKK